MGGVLLIATLFFTLQIYCDFSGYSDIARGTARLFGIRLMTNFRSPYFSFTIREFWGRWHISLSTWFRDYVYIPLGGNKKGVVRRNMNTMITFLLSGLWHGANMTFVLWGVVHGMGQVIENVCAIKNPKRKGAILFLRMAMVFAFTSLAWVLFRANSLDDALYVYSNMFEGIAAPYAYVKNAMADAGVGRRMAVYFCVTTAILCIVDAIALSKDIYGCIDKLPRGLRIGMYYCAAAICIYAYVHNMGSSQFVYFQF